MAKPKVDGVIEAARYGPDGQIQWVRAYLRRGPTFSDHILLDRQALVEQLKAGKHFMAGERVELMGGTFRFNKPIRLYQKNGQEILVTEEDAQRNRDHLEGVPIF
jgi:hypothetical protein